MAQLAIGRVGRELKELKVKVRELRERGGGRWKEDTQRVMECVCVCVREGRMFLSFFYFWGGLLCLCSVIIIFECSKMMEFR